MKVASTITDDEVKDLVDMFDEDDGAMIEGEFTKATVEKKKRNAMSGKSAKELMGKSGARKKNATRPMYEILVDGMTEAQAREYLPPAAGCRIRKYLSLHLRWEIFYPRDSPPRWVTEIIKDLGDMGALNPKESCPYNFDSPDTAPGTD